jgi:hypothetical protein
MSPFFQTAPTFSGIRRFSGLRARLHLHLADRLPLITTFVKASRYVPATVFSVVAALICFIGTTFFSAGPTFLLIARTIIAAAVGHIFAACGYGFFMISQ